MPVRFKSEYPLSPFESLLSVDVDVDVDDDVDGDGLLSAESPDLLLPPSATLSTSLFLAPPPVFSIFSSLASVSAVVVRPLTSNKDQSNNESINK